MRRHRRSLHSFAGMTKLLVLSIILLAWLHNSVSSATLLFDVTNRMGKELPIVVTRIIVDHAELVRNAQSRADGNDIRIVRCSDRSAVPMFIEKHTLNTDSMVCWVRISPLRGAETATLILETDTSRTQNLSNGAAVFEVFDDFESAALSSQRWILPTSSIVSSGMLRPATSNTTSPLPWVLWKGSIPTSYSNAVIEARLRTTSAEGGGSFLFWGTSADGSSGHLLEHSSRSDKSRPDVYEYTNGSLRTLSTGLFRWLPREFVHYVITTRTDSVVMRRTSDSNTERTQTIRISRDANVGQLQSLGWSTFASAPGTFEVDYVHMRPALEVDPIVTQRNIGVTSIPSNMTICNGNSVVLRAPSGWASYKWSNGFNSQSVTLRTPTSLQVTLTDERGCSLTLGPFTVSQGVAPVAGTDTTYNLCFGRKLTLQARTGHASYKWLIGTGQLQTTIALDTPAVRIDSADIYYCIVTSSSGCSDTVTYRVNRVYDASAGISSSAGGSQMCSGDTVLLYAQPPLSSYTWYRNDVPLPETGGVLRITEPGLYRVDVRIGDSANACLSSASIDMMQRTRSFLELPDSLTICQGDTAVLDIGNIFTTASWSTGESARSLRVSTSGVYRVTATINGACKDTASVVVTVQPAPLPRIESVDGRVSMCDGERLELRIDSLGSAIRWNTQDTTSTITVNSPGLYTATTTFPNGCTRISTFTIENGVVNPVITALDNQALCKNETTRLTTTRRYDTYRWSTGEATDTITVSTPGTYTVDVSYFDCRASASIVVDTASPFGPVINDLDTLPVCVASPVAPFTITNTQNVPRIYYVDVVGAGFSASAAQYQVDPQSTYSIPIVYDGSQGGGIHTALINISDACGWQGTYPVTIDYGARTLQLEYTGTADDGGPIRSGQRMNLRIAVRNPLDFVSAQQNDTVWIAAIYDPLHLHITDTTIVREREAIMIDDRRGMINASIMPFGRPELRDLVLLHPEVLTSASLTSTLILKELRTSNPCITADIADTVITIESLPYGCEISTIAWAVPPKLSVVSVTHAEVAISVHEHTQTLQLYVCDMLGHVTYQTTLEPSQQDAIVSLPLHGASRAFIVGINEAASTVLPILVEGH
ncbi:MAG: DUF2341 domain-containing protein [Ignavibacteria bacterium]